MTDSYGQKDGFYSDEGTQWPQSPFLNGDMAMLFVFIGALLYLTTTLIGKALWCPILKCI